MKEAGWACGDWTAGVLAEGTAASQPWPVLVMWGPRPAWADHGIFQEKTEFFFFSEITQYWQLIKTF